MRRAKFAELVSAYLDGEITSGEREALLDEIRRNPGRKQLFSKYALLNSAAGHACFASCSGAARPFIPSRSTLMWCLGGSFAGVAAAFVLMGASSVRPESVLAKTQPEDDADAVPALEPASHAYAQTLAPHFFEELASFRRETVHPFFADLKTRSADAFQLRSDAFLLLEEGGMQGLMGNGDARSASATLFEGQQQALGMTFSNVSFDTLKR
jgi:hypothetical protein